MYTHKVQYYETDKMAVAHHSNYIRWMEEARIDFLDNAGWSFAVLEEQGIISPVVSVNCSYKTPVRFGDTVYIDTRIEEYRGVRLKFAYTMRNADGKIAAEAHSEHCFVNSDGRPIRVASVHPELHAALLEMCADK